MYSHFCPKNCRLVQLAPYLCYNCPSGALGPALNLITPDALFCRTPLLFALTDDTFGFHTSKDRDLSCRIHNKQQEITTIWTSPILEREILR